MITSSIASWLGAVPLFVPGGRSFVPTCVCRGAPRAGTVEVGRRACLASCAGVARPRLDGPEHGARIKRVGTLLLLVLIVINVVDLVFAVDSIPAIFGITTDRFIVYTSNIFAILGLRSMFFLLAGVMDRFHYLKVGLAAVLVFVGVKMVLMDVYHVPIGISLGVIALILGGAIFASWLRLRLLAAESPRPAPGDRSAA